MESCVTDVPLGGGFQSFPNRKVNFIQYTSENEILFTNSYNQTSIPHGPKVFSPVVIYQNSNSSQKHDIIQEVPLFHEQKSNTNTPPVNFSNNSPLYINNEANEKSIFNLFKGVLSPFCENSPNIFSNHKEMEVFPGVLKWRGCKTHECGAQKNDTNLHPHSYQRETCHFYPSAFRRPTPRTDILKKHLNTINLHEENLFSNNVYPLNHEVSSLYRHSPSLSSYSYRNLNLLPTHYIPLSSTMSLSSYCSIHSFDQSHERMFSKICSDSNISNTDHRQSPVSRDVSPLDFQHGLRLLKSKDDVNSQRYRIKKKDNPSKPGNRPYKCHCGRMFARNEELTRHQRIHSGYKPHKCQICNKLFGRKDHLNKHVKTHLHSSQKKIHLCDIPSCGQRYTRSDALARHQMNSHGIKAKPSKWRPQGRVQQDNT